MHECGLMMFLKLQKKTFLYSMYKLKIILVVWRPYMTLEWKYLTHSNNNIGKACTYKFQKIILFIVFSNRFKRKLNVLYVFNHILSWYCSGFSALTNRNSFFFFCLKKYNTVDVKHSFAANYFNLSYVTFVCGDMLLWKDGFVLKTRISNSWLSCIPSLHNKMQSEFHFQNKLSQIFMNDFRFRENLLYFQCFC